MSRSEDRFNTHDKLLANIKANLPKLEEELKSMSDHWSYEDMIYRYYHHSFKVFYIQGYTLSAFNLLKSLAPNRPWIADEQARWDKRFEEAKAQGKEPYYPRPTEFDRNIEDIVKKGTGKTFKLTYNKNWDRHTLPMTQAFFHVKFMLEMAVKYGKELETAPNCLPSGWAALLYFYNLR